MNLKSEKKRVKRELIISKLNKMIALLLVENKEKYKLQISYFNWLVRGLMLEAKFEKNIKRAGKELLKHFNLPDVSNITIQEINELFLELYDVNHPIRNNIETLESVESVRQYLYK